jgi:methylmalonyl-CoA mutase, C-terminal domain
MSQVMRNRIIRVVTGKVGLDGHDRGIKVVSRALRDAGMEVVYVGMRMGVEQLADAVVDQDADIVALNFSGADHLILAPKMVEALRQRGRTKEDLLIVAGGIIPDEDIAELNRIGVAKVFLPGTPMQTIVNYLQENTPRRLD